MWKDAVRKSNVFDLDWFYGAGLSSSSTTGTGGKIYLAQGGFAPAGIAILKYSTIEKDVPREWDEAPSSPASVPNQSFSLLSIGRYPPRSF
jgi:hypothetical protein